MGFYPNALLTLLEIKLIVFDCRLFIQCMNVLLKLLCRSATAMMTISTRRALVISRSDNDRHIYTNLYGNSINIFIYYTN